MTGNNRIRTATLLLVGTLALPLAVVCFGARSAFAGPVDDALAATKARKFEAAAEAWHAVLEKSRGDRTAALGLADAGVRAARADLYASAEEALRGLKAKNAKDVDVLVALGRICMATSAAKEDTLAKKSYDVEAQENFTAAGAVDPKADGPVAGLAQTLYQMGNFAAAIETVDAFLGRNPPAPARALFWKGQTLYLQAQDAYQAAGGSALTPEVTELFRKAQGAYEASTRANGDEPDAWIQLAYASTWLGGEDNVKTADGAYRKAALLDDSDKAPYVGLKSLHTHTPEKYVAALEEILAKFPENAWALWFRAVERYEAKDWKQARALFERYGAASDTPAQGWYYAGVCADQAGAAVEAEGLYFKALKADSNHEAAAGAISQKLMASGVEGRAREGVKHAQQVRKEFTPLLEAAPRMAWIRNNLGFILREAYVGGGATKQWTPVLKDSVAVYTEASEILGEWTVEKERTYNWGQRYAEAQIISDTGLMYQFYEPTRDLAVAERYYRIALEYTDDGYRDAFNNLRVILTDQQRWQELYELCVAAEHGITTEAGDQDGATREVARRLKEQLLASGKAKEDS
ncbi:MAG: tetratricopeptide repeat protein [Planctomycetota bacterium]|nr:tetratricopeptide repeat protein [Planctomycetota bacterium]